MLRKAVVKDVFYPSQPNTLNDFIESLCTDRSTAPSKALICPHAGYVYSGRTAIQTLSATEIPDNVILLGPNHTGLGSTVAVSRADSWESPFGDIPVNKEMASEAIRLDGFSADDTAHMKEHSLEVILPILQYLNPDVQILPICIQQLSWPDCQRIADGIFHLMQLFPDALVVVSSDMNHFESENVSKIKDQLALDAILDMNPEALYHTVMNKRISMCGVFPVVVTLLALNRIASYHAELVSYSHSGDVSGDLNSVVGYAGVCIR